MKFIDLVATANRNLTQSKVRSILTILAIVIGAFTLTTTIALGEGLKQYVANQSAILNVPDTLVATKGSSSGAITGIGAKPTKYDPSIGQNGIQTLDAQDLDTIRLTPNVQRVLPEPSVNAQYLAYGDQKYKTIASDFIPTMQYATVAGRLQDVGVGTNAIALGYGFVDALGFHSPQDAIGKEVTLTFQDQLKNTKLYSFTVKAVLADSLILDTQTLINFPVFQSINEWQSSGIADLEYSYNTASVFLKPGLSSEQQQAVQQALQTKGITTGTYTDSLSVITQLIGSVQTGLALFSAIAIFAAAFGIVNTLYMAVTERTREVGLLKALGMHDGKIFGLFAFEAALIGLWGSALGIVMAMLLGLLLNPIIGQSFEGTLPGFQALVFPFGALLLVLGGITLLALLAGTFPALKAMRQDPIAALRYE